MRKQFIENVKIAKATLREYVRWEPDYFMAIRDWAEKGLRVVREFESDLLSLCQFADSISLRRYFTIPENTWHNGDLYKANQIIQFIEKTLPIEGSPAAIALMILGVVREDTDQAIEELEELIGLYDEILEARREAEARESGEEIPEETAMEIAGETDSVVAALQEVEKLGEPTS